MKIMVMDGQGGGMGKILLEKLHEALPAAELLAVGTNALATAAMLKAGAAMGATGENAVVFNSGRVNIIMGPVGIVAANAMLGEVTPAMAMAVTGSDAQKILIPVERCGIHMAGCVQKPVARYIDDAVELARGLIQNQAQGGEGYAGKV